jgi:hypothetical protein
MTQTRTAARTAWKSKPDAPPIWEPMSVDPSLYLTLAQQACTHCYGLGLRPGRGGKDSVCNCALRGIFRICFARYRQVSSDRAPHMSVSKMCQIMQMGMARPPGQVTGRGAQYGMANHEYAADFILVSERALLGMTRTKFREQPERPEPLGWKVFKMFFLEGRDWRYCCPRLGLDRGSFFHEVYRVEQRLGSAFAEISPIPLFPLGRYFGETAMERAAREAAKNRENRAAAEAALTPRATARAERTAARIDEPRSNCKAAEAPKVMRAAA